VNLKANGQIFPPVLKTGTWELRKGKREKVALLHHKIKG